MSMGDRPGTPGSGGRRDWRDGLELAWLAAAGYGAGYTVAVRHLASDRPITEASLNSHLAFGGAVLTIAGLVSALVSRRTVEFLMSAALIIVGWGQITEAVLSDRLVPCLTVLGVAAILLAAAVLLNRRATSPHGGEDRPSPGGD